MFSYLKKLLWGGHGDDRNREGIAIDKAEMIDIAEPMAGVGAELDGEHVKSETEEILARAASADDPPNSR